MKFRLYPTKTQEILLLEHCRHARYVYNIGLEQRNMYRKEFGPTPNYNAQCAQLTEARKDSWLKDGCHDIQQQALRDLNQSFKNWWKNPKHYGRPTWRKAGQNEGFRIVGKMVKRFERMNRKRARVYILKIGWVDWRWTRNPGDIKSYRVTLDRAGRWWIAFAVIPKPIPAPGNGKIVGIDRGVAQSFVLSTGEMIKIPGLSTVEQQRMLHLKRKLSRQIPGSGRHKKTKLMISKLEHRRVNRSIDAVEKLTTRLAGSFDIIRIENLKIKNMTKSTKGTILNPGKNVKAKSVLNRGIRNNGWGRCDRRFQDKVGDRLEKINPVNTSIRCNVCTFTDTKNRKSQAEFECLLCGHAENADVNAAKNIAAGHVVFSRGGLELSGPVSRVPQLLLV
jgi:transposase